MLEKGIEDLDVPHRDLVGVEAEGCLAVFPGSRIAEVLRVGMVGDAPLEIPLRLGKPIEEPQHLASPVGAPAVPGVGPDDLKVKELLARVREIRPSPAWNQWCVKEANTRA